MKPEKQTVFIKEIHHYDWLIKSHNDDLIGHVKEQEGYFFTAGELNNYTREVIKQALETAAEKAELKDKGGWNTDGTMYLSNMKLEKESITNTAEETFKKFEV